MKEDEISDEVKLLYIEEELSQHGEWLADVLTEAIERGKLKNTGTLLDSINYESFKEDGNPGVRFSFMSYGRAVDIQAYKKSKHKVNTMEVAWGMKENRDSERKKKNRWKRWYASNMYSGYYKLVSRLMYELSDLEIARLKGILANRKGAAAAM